MNTLIKSLFSVLLFYTATVPYALGVDATLAPTGQKIKEIIDLVHIQRTMDDTQYQWAVKSFMESISGRFLVFNQDFVDGYRKQFLAYGATMLSEQQEQQLIENLSKDYHSKLDDLSQTFSDILEKITEDSFHSNHSLSQIDQWLGSEKERVQYIHDYLVDRLIISQLNHPKEELPYHKKTLKLGLNNMLHSLKSIDLHEQWLISISQSYDPHTLYLPPFDYSTFQESMSHEFEGIGVRISTENHQTKIVEIVEGGPASRTSLKANDIIIAVDGKNIDFLALFEVVILIKGPKDTAVELTIQVNGNPTNQQNIRIIRDKVVNTAGYAKAYVFNYKKHRFALLDLPSFYQNMNDPYDRHSSQHHVQTLLKRISTMNTDGLLFDLASNSGGSLPSSIDIAGYFLEGGAVVGTRNKKEIEMDMSPNMSDDPSIEIEYSGPLLIRVDDLTASASEILSGSLQAHHRALIVGDQTFGKGTVQTIYKSSQTKITTAAYYLANHDSIHLDGVTPDIKIPNVLTRIEHDKHALRISTPKIHPFSYTEHPSIASMDRTQLQKKSFQRIKNSSWNPIIQKINSMYEAQKDNPLSLNLETRKKEKQQFDALYEQLNVPVKHGPETTLEVTELYFNQHKKLQQRDWSIQLNDNREDLTFRELSQKKVFNYQNQESLNIFVDWLDQLNHSSP